MELKALEVREIIKILNILIKLCHQKRDGTEIEKVIAPYAFIKHSSILDILPLGITVYFKK